MKAKHRLLAVPWLGVAVFLLSAAVALAASCPYCGQVYGEPAPGDEARVYALRAEHEANCPARYRNTAPDGGAGTTETYSQSYGVVTIYNQTAKPVTYQIQLKAGGAWNRATVQPGRSYYHWQTLPAQFQIRIPNGSGGMLSYNLNYNTVTGRAPTSADGHPFYISGQAGALGFREGSSRAAKPKISSTKCQCGGDGCRCLWDSCGKNGWRKCGCGGKADCDCVGKRCPKFANTTACSGSILCHVDNKYHCNRHGCPDGRGGTIRDSGRSVAGTWGGRLKFGIAGTFNMRLVVNSDGNSVSESGGLAAGTHPATRNGEVLTWRSGVFDEVEWSLTPGPNGENATVTVKSPFGVNDRASFQKQ